MYDRQAKTFHRRPAVFPVKTPTEGRRVRVRFLAHSYDLELEEAMRFADRIVDVAEQVGREA